MAGAIFRSIIVAMDHLNLARWRATSAPGDGQLHPRDQTGDQIINHSALGMSLPCWADRQRIREQAKRVLAEARALAEQSDQTMALLSAERSARRAPQSRWFSTLPGTFGSRSSGGIGETNEL